LEHRSLPLREPAAESARVAGAVRVSYPVRMRLSPALSTWLAVAAVLGVTGALRFMLIEPHEIGHLCLQADAPWWCAVRSGLAVAFRSQAFGWISLAAG